MNFVAFSRRKRRTIRDGEVKRALVLRESAGVPASIFLDSTFFSFVRRYGRKNGVNPT
jgi:hypothetical protein